MISAARGRSMSSNHPQRRQLLGALAAVGGLVLSGCDRLASEPRFRSVLDAANSLTYRVQRLLIGPNRLAPEYSEADISPAFRPNGSTDPPGRGLPQSRRQTFCRLAPEGSRPRRARIVAIA